MKTTKSFILTASIAAILYGCGSTADILSTPVENIDNTPLKVSELTEAEKHNWGHLDLVNDTIPGMSVDKAYAEVIKNKKGKSVIVAVIDSGIDIDHEDLDGVLWTNTKEIANNGKDDDKNGYVDDINGWNFLGDGYDEQLEFVRILASGNKSNPDYSRAETEYGTEYQKWLGRKTQYEQIYQQIKTADGALTKHFGKKDYTKKEVMAIKTEDQGLLQAQQIANYMFSNGLESMAEALKEIERIKTEPVDAQLLKDAKAKYVGNFIMGLESPQTVANYALNITY